ncbi:MAG: hypothetical protein ACLUI3_01445 [Christensenellales bacterium]
MQRDGFTRQNRRREENRKMALSKVNVSQMTNTSKNYDRLPLSYPKDFCSSVRAAASEAGESLAGYVKKAIEYRMQRDGVEPPKGKEKNGNGIEQAEP